MIQYRFKTYRKDHVEWMDYISIFKEPPLEFFVFEDFKIDDKIFTEYSTEFIKAFHKARCWEKLQNKD